MSSAVDTACLVESLAALRMGYASSRPPDPDHVVCPPWTRRDLADIAYVQESLDWLFREAKSGLPLTEERHGWTMRTVTGLLQSFERKERDYLAKAGFNPSQPRVPAGSTEGGRWTESGGVAGGRTAGDSAPFRQPRSSFEVRPASKPNAPKKPRHPHADSPYFHPETGIYDPPIVPVYPVEILIATVYGERTFSLAISAIRRKLQQRRPYNRGRQTDHGHQRVGDRSITDKDIDAAIETAKKSGNITVKNGPYNTPQHHYHGSNGLTVIVETQGRNAGKIITMYGKKPKGKL